MNEIVAAIATPPGIGGIAIIRIVGENVFDFIDHFFVGKNKLATCPANSINYGKVVYETEFLDEVLVSKFVRPYSFTGENTIEINCHGGTVISKKILSMLLDNGARIADPGEFSKLAFLNNKKSLSQITSTIEMINAFSETTFKLASTGLNGKLDEKLEEIYNQILILKVDISVGVDYPEYSELDYLLTHNEIEKFKKLHQEIKKIIKDTNRGSIYKDGIKTAIVGKPNAGKSTLLNLLANENRAIISNIAGTTRDIIHAEVLLNDIKLNLMDTAGIRNTNDQIEIEGILKSKKAINDAELVLFVSDSTLPLDDQEIEILNLIKNKKHLIFNNKIDLCSSVKSFDNQIGISFLDENSLAIVEKEILDVLDLTSFEPLTAVIAPNVTILNSLLAVEKSFSELIRIEEMSGYVDVVEILLNEILEELGNLIGKSVKQDYLNDMFSRFCLGK